MGHEPLLEQEIIPQRSHPMVADHGIGRFKVRTIQRRHRGPEDHGFAFFGLSLELWTNTIRRAHHTGQTMGDALEGAGHEVQALSHTATGGLQSLRSRQSIAAW